MTRSRSRGWGMRLTERYLLPFFGPAHLGDTTVGRGASDADRARDQELRTQFVRKQAPDGRTYFVAPPAPPAPPEQPAP